ncbi:MAG: amidohydrolase family protein [Balneolaceae bacterium]
MNFKLNQMNTIKPKMTGWTSIIAAVILFCFAALPDANAQIPAPQQNGVIALVGGTIYTVSDGVIENGTVVFEDGVITAIGTNVSIPNGAEEVDVTGKQIYPGLIDAYSQMGLFEIGAVGMSVDLNEQGIFNPNVKPEVAFNPESRHIGTARTAGVLVAVSTPSGGVVSGQSSAMMLDGWSWENMLIKSGAGLVINWPNTGDEEEYGEALQIMRDEFDKARAYKNARQAVESGNANRIDLDSKLESMFPVFNGDRAVVVNANELRQIQDAITWAEEEDLKLVILGGRDSHYVAGHLQRKDIPVIVTNVLTAPNRDWEAYDSRYSLPAKLHEAGVTFAIAGAASAPYAYRLPWEAGAAAAYGLDVDEALRSVTLSPAQILGFDDRVGSLEVGKDATLFISTGNPMEYSTQIDQAYIEGRKIDMMDSHRELYEKYRQKVDQRNTDR